MSKTSIILMFIIIISKISGFIRDITLSYFYGASGISDAYLISLTIPSVVFTFVGVGIATGYIPMYSQIESEHGELEGKRFTNNLVNILFIISTIIFIFSQLFTTQLVKLFASGFEGETLLLAIKFTRISLIGIYFTGLRYIFAGYLQLKHNYIAPELMGVPFNFIVILAIFISYKTDPVVLAIGLVIAAVAQIAMLIPFLRKKGYKYKMVLDIKDKYAKKMLMISIPVIIGTSVDQVNVLVDRTLASGIAVGGISALDYAAKINSFVQGVFVVSITTVMYPMISKMAAKNDINGLKTSIVEAISSINILVIPATVGAMVFSQPIVELLFGRGAFDSSAVSMTSTALFFYSIGMLGVALRQIISSAFYSMQDTKTPMINGIIAVVINIILNIILSRFMGVAGLALGTSISVTICTGLLFISLRKKIGSFQLKRITVSFIKILFTSLIMGVIAKISFEALTKTFSPHLSLLISMGIGAIVYGVIIFFMKIKEVDFMIEVLKEKLKKD